MFASVRSAHLLGIAGIGVDVEVDVSNQGLPSFTVVGLAEGALKESKERVRSSLKNLGHNIFARPITINLAPADFKKEGTHYDLPIALGLLGAAGVIPLEKLLGVLILGELSLDGRLRGVSGVLPMVESAKNEGVSTIILPIENANEASLIEGVNIYPFSTLTDVVEFITGTADMEPFVRDKDIFADEPVYLSDFSDVRGQFAVRRAAEIAAAGMHNIILVGSPGSGKTMIAKRLPSILPPMNRSEALETTKIHSVAGLLKEKGRLITTRPFISPHHTASNIAIIGGGAKAKPGHVSIASGGVLFLDEMLEFGRNVLEVLRQPLEDKTVTIARAGRTVTYPAKFMLVGAMNPCPCGYYGDDKRECTCSIQTVERYKSRLSGPMLDRIDMHVQVSSVDYKDLMALDEGEPSFAIRSRVGAAHERQNKRFAGSATEFNSQMTERQITEFCKLDDKTSRILENAMNKYTLSARAHSKILKTARTIADLAACENIQSTHMLEALQFRILDNA